MKTLFASSTLLVASAALFAAGVFSQSETITDFAAPTSLSVMMEYEAASGPTFPPIDEQDLPGGTNLASGPTFPPIDEEDLPGGTNLSYYRALRS
ncbi:MAG TPA: hypothetical protein VEX68_00475 [Bryobacteraceae bacterium]|nr:hypothetical protein [Bryobacteraceae bacterium]